LYDATQVVVVENTAQQDLTNNYVVQVAGNDTLESTAIRDATAGQLGVKGSTSSFDLLACVHVNAEKDTSTYGPLKSVDGDSLDDGDDGDAMVGGIDDDAALVFGGRDPDSPRLGRRVHALSTDVRADQFFASDRSDNIDGDDPDLIDGFDTSADSLVGSDDDLDLVALAGSGSGYGGYGGVPEITDFVGVPNQDDTWTFTGNVNDDIDPTDSTVTLNGLVDATVTVAENDTFSVATEVESGAFGWVGVTVTDDVGNVSAVSWFLVDNGP
jgi:hypothetical protein